MDELDESQGRNREPVNYGGPGGRSSLRRMVGVLGPRLALVILLAAAVLYWSLILPSLKSRSHHWDFSIYYLSALALRKNIDPYKTNLTPSGNALGLETGALRHAADTPAFLLLFEPLTLLSPERAYWIWMTLSLAPLIISLLLLLGPGSGLGAGTAWTLAALAAFYPPLVIHVRYSQSQLIVLLLCVMMLRSVQRQRDASAGLILAAASLLRAYPLVLLGYLAVRRRWRALTYAVVGLGLGGVVVLAAAGRGPVLSFMQAVGLDAGKSLFSLPPSQELGTWNVSLNALTKRIFAGLAGQDSSFPMELVRKFTWIASVLAVLYFTIKASVLHESVEDSDGGAFALWIVTMLLISPLTWNHYMVLLMLPYFLLAAGVAHDWVRRRTVFLAVGSYIVMGLGLFRPSLAAGFWTHLGTIIVDERRFISLMMVYVVTLWFIRDRKVPA